jgi:acyl-CoA thioester hydrolase
LRAIRWFESGRVAYPERLGLGGALCGKGLGPILAAINCNYRRPVNHPDAVYLGTRVTKVGKSSITIAHAIFSESLQSIAADGDSVVVMFNYGTQKSSRVPDDLRAAIATQERRKL